MPSLRRILARLGDDPFTALAQMPASELRTLMLPLLRARAEAITPHTARRAAARDLLFEPSRVDARELHALEGLCWRATPAAFEGLALGPALPFGAHHALAGTPQDNVLSATRASEVLGDPTVALALVAAQRRAQSAEVVRLATASRPVRMQPLKEAGHTRHFALFALLSSGRVRGADGFEIDAVVEHLGAWTRLAELAVRAGYDVRRVSVRLTDMRLMRAIAARHGVGLAETRWQQAAEDLAAAGLPSAAAEPPVELLPEGRWEPALRLHAALRERLPEMTFAWDFSRTRQATYYTSFAFHVRLDGPHGERPVIDGGFVDWVASLSTNARERTLTSGAGIELLARLYASR